MALERETPVGLIEGVDGKYVVYRERLLPAKSTWLLIVFMTVSLGIAYGYVYGANIGSWITVASTLIVFLITFWISPVLHVDELVLRVGNARLPRKFVGSPKILDKTQTLKSRRSHTHRNAYLVLRASIPESVLIEVRDETDPHPYWQFSSRNPVALLAALESKHDV
jgi:hypothetical protein